VNLDALQESFFLERVLVQLGQGLRRPQDDIDQQARETEDCHEERRGHLQEDVGGTPADVAERPPHAGDPERHEVRGDDRDADPEDAL